MFAFLKNSDHISKKSKSILNYLNIKEQNHSWEISNHNFIEIRTLFRSTMQFYTCAILIVREQATIRVG